MEDVLVENIKDKDLSQTVQDFVDSRATKMVVTEVADDNWKIVATVPRRGGN